MNDMLKKANEAAIYNIFLCLSHILIPDAFETLESIIYKLNADLKFHNEKNWSDRDIYRLSILKNAIQRNALIANSQITNFTHSQGGLTASCFINPENEITVAFKGTGRGEWIDNGQGLSGIPEENTYITYDNDGKAAEYNIVKNDFATDQQVEALNWFNYIIHKNHWNDNSDITVCGHSKGGNKAQFVAIHSDAVNQCFSFNGQGFSPEAISDFSKRLGTKFETRRKNIFSLSTDNDYVNVLGNRLMPKSNIYYYESHLGLHYMEAMLDENGNFNPQTTQGKLSQYIETVSNEIMNMRPAVRQYATVGIMNIFQKYLVGETPVNGETVSIEKTIAGIGVAIGPLVNSLKINDK